MADPVQRPSPGEAHLPGLRAAGSSLLRRQKGIPFRERLSSGLEQGVLSAVAAVLAWMPTEALGLREGFWAAITAIAVAQSEFNAARSTARDQFAGAAIGGAVAVLTTTVVGPGIVRFVLALMIAISCCWMLKVASAARLGGITAAIIMLVPHQASVGGMMLSRVGEVGWGVTMAILVTSLATLVRDRLRRGGDKTAAE